MIAGTANNMPVAIMTLIVAITIGEVAEAFKLADSAGCDSGGKKPLHFL